MEINGFGIGSGIILLIICLFSSFMIGAAFEEARQEAQKEVIYKPEIIYINQTDNCLNEVINKFEENQEVIDIITEYIQKIGG